MEKITATFCVLIVIGALLVRTPLDANSGPDEADSLTNSAALSTALQKTTSGDSTKTTKSTHGSSGLNAGENAVTIKKVLDATPKPSNREEEKDTEPSENGSSVVNSTTAGGSTTNGTVPTRTPTTKNNQTTNATVATEGPKTSGATPKDAKTTVSPPSPPPPTKTKAKTTAKPPPITPRTTAKGKSEGHEPEKGHQGSSRITYIIIFTIVILCLIGAIGFCCLQNKTRSFSISQSSKSEDAHIPLSAVETEVFEPSAAKDLQAASAEDATGSGGSAAPANNVEEQDEEKVSSPAPTEANQQEKASSADSQATVPQADKAEELIVVDLNDGEPTISNKTSVETLDEPVNENNSNNRAQANGGQIYGTSGNFTEIYLDDPL